MHAHTHMHACTRILLYMHWHIMRVMSDTRDEHGEIRSAWCHAHSNMQDEFVMSTQRYSTFLCHTHIFLSSCLSHPVCMCVCVRACDRGGLRITSTIAISMQIFQAGLRKSLRLLSSLMLTCSQQLLALLVGWGRSPPGEQEKTQFSRSCYLSVGLKHHSI